MSITEKEFQRQVIDLARILGWDYVYHPMLSKWSEKGWPDLVLCRSRDGRMVMAELKSQSGRLTHEQDRVLQVLRICHVDVYVWRPDDIEYIARILA